MSLLLSVTEAAAALGVGETMIWALLRSGALPSCRMGRRRLLPLAGLEVYAERLCEVEALERGDGS